LLSCNNNNNNNNDNNNNNNNNNKVWESALYDAFNEAYQSYLNNISPGVFMTIFLEKVIKRTDSKSGFVASIHKVDQKNYLIPEAIDNKLFVDEVSMPQRADILLDIDDVKSIYTYAVKKRKIVLMNDSDIDVCDLGNNNVIKLIDKNDMGTFFCNGFIDIKSCVCIPYLFNNELIGIITLVNRFSYDTNMIPYCNILGSLMGVLQNNYFTFKKTSIDTDTRFVTYQLFECIANYTRDGTLVTDPNFDIIYNNQCALNIINMMSVDIQQKLINQNIIKIFPQLNILAGNNHKLFRGRRIIGKIENNKAIMCPFVLEFNVNSIICHNKIYHIIMIHNNTDNVSYEQKNQANFIAYLSHELRNPLQSINLANHLLQIHKGKSEENNSKYLDTISRSCFEMKKIINDILDLSKIEAHEFIIELDTCDIRDLANNIINEFTSLALEKGLLITLNIHDDIPETIYTDEVRLSQILSNLISNAIKYSTSGEIKLDISYDESEHGIKFNVVDQGDGIRKDEISNLFKQFCHTSSSDKFNSNGLGLWISQKIAHLLGGNISVVSEHKKGSTFTLFHPIKLANSGNFQEKVKFAKDLVGKILIVDDNESNLMLFRLMLDHFNCEHKYNLETHSVKDGKDAVELCKVNVYDIIFMDINMPGIDGCTASKLIRLNGFTGKIIATTGNIMAKKENSSLMNNQEKYKCFDDVVIKPYDDTVIMKILNKFLPSR